ncbi:MAG: peptidoglycan-binding protein [Sphingopyxis sp.]|nr:MAG: peptidoglycan-binding protein [Sphingopyxis sp.]
MIAIDLDVLRNIMPRFSGANHSKQARIVEAIAGTMQATLEKYEIDTALRIAHFLAQIAHESAGFRTTEEFASGAAYEGRRDLGNSEPGDGRRYKGRGLLQLTGRANYRALGKKIGMDLEGEPELAAEPATSLVIACEYWKDRKINRHCDRDDLIRVTKAVNGGLNGLEDRRRYLSKAKTAIARVEALGQAANAKSGPRPVLRRGLKGGQVSDLQRMLREKGYMVAIDGDFGPATETIVKQFQKNKKLGADGIVGPKTWQALEG